MKTLRWSAVAAVAAAALVALSSGCGGSDQPPADTVFQHGDVVTLDSGDTRAQAVAVRDGKIVFVGSDQAVQAYVGAKTQVIDLQGRMLMPGFVDAHVHSLAAGRALLVCDMAYAPLSQAQLAARVQACLDSSTAKEPDTWLEVVNWDRASTSQISGDPTRALLDGLSTQRPIVITSSDFHTVLANSRALAVAGITSAVADPSGGKFGRASDGSLTGICEDAAGWLVKGAIPADTDADLVKQAQAALSAMRAQGVTSFMDAAAGAAHGQAFKTVQQAGELTARAQFAVNMSPEEAAADPVAAVAEAKALAAAMDQGQVGVKPGLSSRIIKIFMDGVVNAPADTGAMLAPYFKNTGTESAPQWVAGTNVGSVYYPPEVLKPLLRAAADAGLDVHAHATGDRAVRQMLDGVAQLRTDRPQADFRPAIAHAETVDPADYPRFEALGVTATMSLQWAQRAPYSIGETEAHLGPVRFARMEPSGSLALAGARVAYGSDWPIDPYDIFLALKIGVTRSGDPQNPNSAAFLSPDFEGPINADPALSRMQTLRAITINAAHQLRLETQVGTIERGKLADLIILDKNFLTVAAEELGRNQVLLTMVGGDVVLAAEPFAAVQSAARRSALATSRVLSPRGSTGHAVVTGGLPGSPHGDGHRH